MRRVGRYEPTFNGETLMRTLKLFVGPTLGAALAATSALGITKATAADAGNCGEYNYWHDGKCVDARDKPAKAWAESMTSKPAW